jgi:hypothetical protein
MGHMDICILPPCQIARIAKGWSNIGPSSIGPSSISPSSIVLFVALHYFIKSRIDDDGTS